MYKVKTVATKFHPERKEGYIVSDVSYKYPEDAEKYAKYQNNTSFNVFMNGSVKGGMPYTAYVEEDTTKKDEVSEKIDQAVGYLDSVIKGTKGVITTDWLNHIIAAKEKIKEVKNV